MNPGYCGSPNPGYCGSPRTQVTRPEPRLLRFAPNPGYCGSPRAQVTAVRPAPRLLRLAAHSVSRGKISEVTARPLTDVVYALCNFEWEFKLGDATIALSTRVTSVLRERQREWSLLHMRESIVWKPAG